VDYSDSEDEDEIIKIESEDKEAEDSEDEVIETESNKKEDVESEDKEAEDSEDEVIEPESNKEDVENLEEIEAQVKDKEIDIESPPLCCIPCALQISDNCKVCLFCKDKPKYGGLNKLKQKCIKRTCLKKRKRVETIMNTKSSSTSTTTRQSKRRKGMKINFGND